MNDTASAHIAALTLHQSSPILLVVAKQLQLN